MAARSEKLFYSYSSADEVLRTELEKHLTLVKRQGVIETWSFRKIDAGTDWKKSIDANLETATIVLLLISADFIASNYCWDIEMKRALERHESGDAIVVPIILKPCDWKTAPFARLQALPEDARPVTNWRPRDRAWTNVVIGLRRVIQQAIQRKPRPAPPSVAGNPSSSSEKKVSAVERAKRGAEVSKERKSRDARLQTEDAEGEIVPRLIDTETWECPNHTHCGAWAYIKTYECGCVRVEWQDRGTYDPRRCAHNPEEHYGPNYPRCAD